MEYRSPWMPPTNTFPGGTPLTFEQRGQYLLNDILAYTKRQLEVAEQTYMRVDLSYHVLVEIRDELRQQNPMMPLAPAKPGKRK